MLMSLFYIDTFSLVLISLVAYVGAIVLLFARRYMRDDTHCKRFLFSAALLCGSLMLMVVVNNYMVFVVAWCLVQLLMVRILIHNPLWKAAYAAGLRAARQFFVATLFLLCGFCMIYHVTGTMSITDALMRAPVNSPFILLGVSCLFLAAAVQSALWPFHRWLLSASHAPLPGLALINACTSMSGIFVLIRFLPLYALHVWFMHTLFAMGLVTVLIGMLFTAVQTDRRRKLACSTMAQMGFVAVWCGLGLIALAIAQICFHSLFKAYCVLLSPSAAQEKRMQSTPQNFAWAVVCGIAGSALLMSIGTVFLESYVSYIFFAGCITLALTELSLSFLMVHSWNARLYALSIALFAAVCYAVVTNLVMNFFGQYDTPQALSVMHGIGFVFIVLVWLFVLFQEQLLKVPALLPHIYRLYVKLVNASQPYATTITATHSLYDVSSLSSSRKANHD